MSILTCPLCYSDECAMFYDLVLIYPNFDNPKDYHIELKYICSQNDNNSSSINLQDYQNIISLNEKFKINEPNKKEKENKKLTIDEKEINEIINNSENIQSTNEIKIIEYLKSKNCTEIQNYYLLQYLELNKILLFFIKTFFKELFKFHSKNLVSSLYYILKMIQKNKQTIINDNILKNFYISNQDIYSLPFIIKLNKLRPKSFGTEILLGHTLPIVGLTQLKNGLIISGSCGLLKIWDKNNNIKSEMYNKFECINTIKNQGFLVTSIIELENNIVAYGCYKNLVEALITKEKYEIIFIYKKAENSIYSVCALNNKKYLACCGTFKNIYIFNRENKNLINTISEHSVIVNSLIEISNLNFMCSCDTDSKINIFKIDKNFDLYQTLKLNETHILAMCNLNENDFCATTMNGFLWVYKWEISQKKYIKEFNKKIHNKPIYGLYRIKGGKIITSSTDNTMKFWDINKKICISMINLQPFESYDVICKLNDGRLCCGATNKIVRIFNNLLLDEKEVFIKNN